MPVFTRNSRTWLRVIAFCLDIDEVSILAPQPGKLQGGGKTMLCSTPLEIDDSTGMVGDG